MQFRFVTLGQLYQSIRKKCSVSTHMEGLHELLIHISLTIFRLTVLQLVLLTGNWEVEINKKFKHYLKTADGL